MPEPWSRELLERWPHLQVVHGYGLTEYTSPVALLPSEYAGTRGDSVGFPVRGARVRLADESGNEVPMGATGEILVTGPSRMVEYWKNPEATSAKLHGDWLRTGDLGRREDLLLYVEGRLDDVINRGGEKIQPAFVEAAISTFPDVAEVAVFPVPDPILQERLMAVVRTRSGRALLGDQLRRHLLRSVPDYAIPEEFIVVRELPRSQSGKVDRRSLVATYAKRGARDGEVADVQT